MGKAIFMSYNAVGGGSYPKVVKRGENTAIIVQYHKGNIERSILGNQIFWKGRPSDPVLAEEYDDLHITREEAIKSLYAGEINIEEALDYVVIYIGINGSGGAIGLTAQIKTTHVFVLCRCNLADKLKLIRQAILDQFKVIKCECGGRSTMGQLVETFLDTGFV